MRNSSTLFLQLVRVVAIILGVTLTSFNGRSSVLEVTTFKIKPTADNAAFNLLDQKVESTFTSKQPGFVKRQSGVSNEGEYVVLVYWETVDDANASMQKFMSDKSVSDYASMIDAATMKMSRFEIKDHFKAQKTEFVEVMTYKALPDVELETLNETDKQVENNFTKNQKGFLQRITGLDESGRHLVTVYWDTQDNSDAALQPFMESASSKKFMGMMDQSSIHFGRYKLLTSLKSKNMELSKKDKVVALLNSFNTGDQTPISYINPEKYIQHNLAVGDGLAGFGEVIQNAPEGGFSANVVRAFQDGDYVFTHTEYDFFGPKAAFDVFRFEDGLIVEHWDNLSEITPPNPSGRTQLDGATEITDTDKTEAYKNVVKQFVDEVLLEGKMDNLTTLVNPQTYIQHNSGVADGLDGLGAALEFFEKNNMVMIYDANHKILGEGNFVLSISEGKFGPAPGAHVAYYDLFRLENGQIVEHWDVIEEIPSKEEWKNKNGKF